MVFTMYYQGACVLSASLVDVAVLLWEALMCALPTNCLSLNARLLLMYARSAGG